MSDNKCSVELVTTSGTYPCNMPAKARGMCNAHLIQESRNKELTIPRGWRNDMNDSSNARHSNAIDSYLATVTWLEPNDPLIEALRATARELDANYSNATLNQHRLLLKDVRDMKRIKVEETEEQRVNRILAELDA